MTSDEFMAAEAAGEFLESAVVHGNRYGTLKTPVDQALAQGKHVILEIDVQGARSVRKARPDAVAVFIEPPSWEVLEARLTGRGTDDAAVVSRRLKNAREELAAAPEFDERVVNDRLEDAVDQVDRILQRTP
jgi:guanylate kinase